MRVVVVGAGIAGLSAAWRLVRALPEADVVVLEAADRVGGKLALGEVGGVDVDLGAESVLARRPEGVALAQEAGLADDLVHPETTSARVFSRGSMAVMPRTVMGVPADLDGLARSGILSPAGLARVRADAVLPATDIDGRDVSVGELVGQRLGDEVVDRLVEPLLGGVYAGHARELSARATVPQVVALLDRDRSLVAAAAATPSATLDTPVFAGVRGGVGRLPLALVENGGFEVRTGVTVRALARSAESGGFVLTTGPRPTEQLLKADGVVVATPGAPASRLLAGVASGAARELAEVEYASMAIVTMAFAARDLADLPGLEGSGFLVPPVDGLAVKAATFSSRKWAWVADAGAAATSGADAAPGGVCLLRASIGRHREEHVLQRTDEELVDLALGDLATAVGLSVRPVDAHVQRWGGSLPQYAVGHLERVARVREVVDGVEGLAVCGAAYDGLGIPACIATGERAAEKLAGDLTPSGLGGGGRMEP